MIALIPARSGSSLKDKNIYNLVGYPLMAWSIAIGKQLDLATWVITDSPKYIEIAKSFNALTIDEPSDMAQSQSGDFPYLKYVFKNIDDNEILLLRPTTPLREVDIVKKAIGQFKNFGLHTSLRSAYEMSESAYKCVVLSNGYFMPIIEHPDIPEFCNLPRQQVPKTYHPNGYVDIIMRSTIEKGMVYGDRVQPFLTEDVGELDTQFDIDYIEWLAVRQRGGTTFEYLRNKFNPQSV